MTVDELIVRVRTLGTGAAAAEVGNVERAAAGLGRTAKFVAGVAGIGALAFGLSDITRTAISFQNQQASLANALRNTGQYSAANAERLVAASDALSTHGGFDPSTSLSGIQSLIRAHDSVSQAIRDNVLVTDIARARNIPYATALRAVMIVEQGRTTGLARLGIVVPKVTTAQDALANSHKKVTVEMRRQALAQDAQAQKTEALRVLWHRYGGETEAFTRTAAGAVSNLRNSIDVLAQRLGAALLPAITVFVRGLTSIVNLVPGAVQWFKRHSAAAEALKAALAGVGALLLVYYVNVARAALVTRLWTENTLAQIVAARAMAFIGALGALFGLLAEGEGAAAVASLALSTAWGAMSAALIATGIGALIVGIGVAIYMLITHFKEVKKWVTEAFGTMLRVIKEAWSWVMGHWYLLLPVIYALTGPIGLIAVGVALLVTHFKDVERIATAVFNAVLGVVKDVWGWIAAHWKLLAAIFLGPIGLVLDAVVTHFGAIKKFIIGVFNAVVGAVRSAGRFIVGVFTGLVGILRGPVTLIWDVVTWPFREAIRIAGTVGGAVLHFLTLIPGLVSGAMHTLRDIVTWPFREMIRIATTIWGVIGPPLTSLAGTITGAMQSLWNILTWPFREAIKFVNQLIGLIGKVAGPLQKVVDAAGSVGGAITGTVGDVAGFLGIKQGGGPITRGGFYDVGEQGRERVWLPSGAYVQPNHELGGGAAVLHLTDRIPVYVDGRLVGQSLVRRSLALRALQ